MPCMAGLFPLVDEQRRWNALPRKRDLRLSGQIWGNPNETRAAAHSASTVHPIHDVQPDHSG